jgi:hypothetical protein
MPSRSPVFASGFLVAGLLALTGCERREPPDTGTEPISLDPFRKLMDVPLTGAQEPTRIVPLESRGMAFVLDRAAGRVLVLDPYLRASGDSSCIDASGSVDFDVSSDAYRGRCPESKDATYVEVHRGYLQPTAAPVAVAVDPDALEAVVVDASGAVDAAPADILLPDPFDWLRLSPVRQVDPPEAGENDSFAATSDGVLWLASGNALRRVFLSERAEEDASFDLGDSAGDLTLVQDEPWVVTHSGLWVSGSVVDLGGPPARLTGDGARGAWLSVPLTGELVHVGEGPLVLGSVAVDGLLGPIGLDARSGRLYAATEQGVEVLAEQGESYVSTASYEVDTSDLQDLVATGTHEILLLSGSTVSVWVDEESLRPGAPLSVFTAGFAERPRNEEDDVPCGIPEDHADQRKGEETIWAFSNTAARNREFLSDLKAPLALGVTPWLARRLGQCHLADVFRPAWDAARTEVGVLFHDPPSSCKGDADCYLAGLGEDLGYVQDLGADDHTPVHPTWATGMDSHYDQGFDWVAALFQLDFTRRFAFFGISVLPEISADDPRGKDAFPLDIDDRTTPWRAAGAAATWPGDPSGRIAFFPGNSIAAFTLSGCAGLLLNECRQVAAGGGTTLDQGDVAILDLLLHRSLAWRSEDGPSTWYFHLPDIGVYDYTQGCSHDGTTWSGESCQAAILQSWLDDVARRFVANGLVQWRLPGELDMP